MNTQSISLDVSKVAGATQVVRIGQGDANGTTLAATIYDNGTILDTTDMTARFVMLLPNGTNYYRETATLSGGVATVTIDESYAASTIGKTDIAYFEILDDGGEVICSTNRFTIIVLRSALEGTEEPESWDNEIYEATYNATVAASRATTAADSASSAASAASAAAEDASSAAEDARGAVPPQLALYLKWVEDEDGDNIMAVTDVWED